MSNEKGSLLVIVNHYKYYKDPYSTTGKMEGKRPLFRGSRAAQVLVKYIEF